MKKKLLLIAACVMALNAPVQAEMSHKKKTIISGVIASLGLVGMGVTGKYWYDYAQKLENVDLTAAEREKLHKVISNLKAGFVGSSVLTAGATAYAINQRCGWNDENKMKAKIIRKMKKERKKNNAPKLSVSWKAFKQDMKKLTKLRKKNGTLKAKKKEFKDEHKRKEAKENAFHYMQHQKTLEQTNYLSNLSNLSTYDKRMILGNYYDNAEKRKINREIAILEKLVKAPRKRPRRIVKEGRRRLEPLEPYAGPHTYVDPALNAADVVVEVDEFMSEAYAADEVADPGMADGEVDEVDDSGMAYMAYGEGF